MPFTRNIEALRFHIRANTPWTSLAPDREVRRDSEFAFYFFVLLHSFAFVESHRLIKVLCFCLLP